jgi:large subunit ribosomal protein L6
MSRIGKLPIAIPAGVQVKISEKGLVTVKGNNGELSQQIVDPAIKVTLEDGTLTVTRETEQKRHRALHGLYRALINNMVVGVSQGYKHTMEIHGVGFRCSNRGQLLELQLGYSHPIFFVVPNEVKLETKMEKGLPPTVTISGHDKQLLGQVAAKIRSFRAPEPYKGKGIRFTGEVIRRKAGKAAAKK